MLGKSGDRLQVKKKSEVIGERRLVDVSQVILFGSVMVSAQALSEMIVRGITITAQSLMSPQLKRSGPTRKGDDPEVISVF